MHVPAHACDAKWSALNELHDNQTQVEIQEKMCSKWLENAHLLSQITNNNNKKKSQAKKEERGNSQNQKSILTSSLNIFRTLEQ